jgi:hypothetical protein
MAENIKVLDALKNFVEENKSNLQRVKSENPALHDVVLDTLIFLNKKFGNQDVTKEEIFKEEAVAKTEDVIVKNISPTFKLGDILKVSWGEKIPNQIYIITKIDSNDNIVTLKNWDLLENDRNPKSIDEVEIKEVNRMIDSGEYEILDLESIIKVGDIFKETNLPPIIIKEITKVDALTNRVINDSYYVDGTTLTDNPNTLIFWLKKIKENLYEKYFGTTSGGGQQPVPIAQPAPIAQPVVNTQRKNTEYAVGDLFIGGDVVDFPQYVYEIMSITSQFFNIEIIDLDKGIFEQEKPFQRDFIADVESGKLKRFYPFEIGDVLIYTLYDKEIIKVQNIKGSTLDSTVYDEKGNLLEMKKTWQISTLLELMYNGALEYENKTIIASVSQKLYKVGDKFRVKDDISNPPNEIWEIINISNDKIKYSITSTFTNTILTYTDALDFFDNNFYKDLVPYVESVNLTIPSSKPKQAKTPKAKTPKSAPAPIETNQSVVNLSCKEIKNAIKDLTLLVDLGDDTVLDEINELKQLLKTQNCK